jgi:hypothetical protein
MFRHSLLVIPALLACSGIAAFADTIPPGTRIEVRPDSSIDVAHWDRGRIYYGRVAQNITARDGDVAIPQGAQAELIVRETGPNQFVLDLESITVQGRRYAMDTTGPQFDTHRRDYDEGRGVVGAIAGAIAGATGQYEPRGEAIRVPAGAVLNFTLEQPLRTVDWQDPGYQRDQWHYHRDNDWYR